MPIYVNGQQVNLKAVAEEAEAKKKKAAKYTLNHKNEPTDKQYEEAKIVINGQEKTLSKASNYLLDMISDEEK